MAGPGGAYFNIPEFVGGSRQLAQDGANAGEAGQGGLNGFTPPGANSPHGQIATGKLADWHGQLATAPPQISNDANGNDQYVQGALQDLQGIDSQNAGLVKAASQDPMDPESIDKDAQSEAKDMLNNDQTDQQMQQILQELLQEGMQFGQQASQQIGQLVNQLNQAMGQVVQQVSQIASQAAGQAASHAASDALNAAGAGLADGLGGAGDAGAGAGTIPAGLEEPVTPMTTSPALVQGTGPIAPAATPATAAGARMPMMPMMPMHGRQGEKDKRKRNPNIFPVGRLYEPPTGTVQNFGANPEIDAEAPPFGTAKSA